MRLTEGGTLLSLTEGATFLQVTRGNISAATTLTVGSPQSANQLMTAVYGIDAYPDTVTVLPNGGERRIVTKVDPEQEHFFDGAASGTTYVSSDSSVATVDADGVIRHVGVGTVTITVINGWGEDQVQVSVLPALIGDSVAIDATPGGIVQNAEGIQIAFGPGGLSDDAVVTVTSMSEAELPIPMPTIDELSFVGAFNLDVTGAEFDDTVQIAVPVPNSRGEPGDQVWFFVSEMLPVGENGELIEVWRVVNSGTIDENGMARANSPPFPGLSQRGSVLIARAANPRPTLRVDVGFTTAAMLIYAPALGIAATGGLAGSVAANRPCRDRTQTVHAAIRPA